ncbi:hypothetical protein L1785_18890 [Antribacter sp. KLBMP9083]|uniref:DUF4386 family protein n=1 Tax=Antribacter soli TaxID=2910976 RepID=A0AA41U8S5_9MICO|nr:hypothetical protein [Antribacter soli]MCF4123046.1 hypothetical protein [Antribacter soli]
MTMSRTASPQVARWTAASLTLAGILFLLFPVLRPWPDETVATMDLAAAFASDRWVLAHVLGILGLTLLGPAFLGLRTLLGGTRGAAAATAATAAAVTAWAGASLSALYFGAEIFGIRTIAQAATREGDAGLLADVEVLRMQPMAATLFAIGLLLLAVAGVLVATALWRSGGPTRWAGLPLAAGLLLVLPQFWGGPSVRIAHGVLVAVGCLLAAWAVRATRAA